MISEIIISLSLYLETRELTRRFLLHCQLKFLPFNVYSIIDGNVLNPKLRRYNVYHVDGCSSNVSHVRKFDRMTTCDRIA